MVTKVMLYNIALSALRLNYKTTDPDNDVNKAVKELKSIYELALAKTLSDLDLNRTSTKFKLELLTETHPHWEFVYKYPNNCAKFRRITSSVPQDNRDTRIPCGTESVNSIDCIVTNESEAYADIQPSNGNLSALNPSAAFALGYMMAIMCPGLIVGKGSTSLRQSLMQEYMIYKAEAQEDDMNENVDTTPDEFKSDWVAARLGGQQWRTKT